MNTKQIIEDKSKRELILRHYFDNDKFKFQLNNDYLKLRFKTSIIKFINDYKTGLNLIINNFNV